ncbi:hypothetical protein MPTK2_3g00540 [Marchantia polymorpha subsp. ruderalis]
MAGTSVMSKCRGSTGDLLVRTSAALCRSVASTRMFAVSSKEEDESQPQEDVRKSVEADEPVAAAPVDGDEEGEGEGEGNEFVNEETGEIGGPRGPEPTRYGDWEKGGRCSDF